MIYYHYLVELNQLKEAATEEAKESRQGCNNSCDGCYYSGVCDCTYKSSDTRLFCEKASPIFSEILQSDQLTSSEIFQLFQHQYSFAYQDDSRCSKDSRFPKTLRGFEVLNFKDQTEIFKEKALYFVDLFWAEGANIKEITRIYQCWFDQKNFFSLLTKKILYGPWTKKQCQEMLENQEFLTYLIELPQDEKKLEIIDTCLEKYPLKNNSIFNYSPPSKQRLVEARENTLINEQESVEVVEVYNQLTSSTHTYENNTFARAITEEDNPYVDYGLMARTNNTLLMFTQLQANKKILTRIDIPNVMLDYINISIARYNKPESIFDNFYARQRSKKATFLTELMTYISKHPIKSYQICVNAFRNLRRAEFDDTITEVNMETGNVHRILLMLISLDQYSRELLEPSAPPEDSVDAQLR